MPSQKHSAEHTALVKLMEAARAVEAGEYRSDKMMALASSGIFSLKFPDHPITQSLKAVVEEIKK